MTAMTLEVFSDQGQAVVTVGGNTTPSPGSSETWTANVTTPLPAASPSAVPPTVWFGYDPFLPAEQLLVTTSTSSLGSQSVTVTRGINGVVVSHTAPFVLVQATTAASYKTLQNRGLLWLTGGGTITSAMITTLAAAGVPGLWLDPNNVWHMGGVVISGSLQNFDIYMGVSNGSIGWSGNVAIPAGFIDTGSGTDGIQIYATTPSGATGTQGVIFRNCVIKGSNTNAVVHFGGGQRACGLVDTLVFNTNSAANSYGLVVDTQLSNNNSEDMILSFTGGGGVAGNWGAIGWGVNDQSGGHPNDATILRCVTASGNTSFNHASGGGVTLIQAYDRSNPTNAVYQNNGGTRLTLIGGEDQNSSGKCHIVTAGETVLENRAVTATTGGQTTVSVSGGKLVMRGNCVSNVSQVLAVSGSGVLDISDPNIDGTNFSVSGSAGLLVQAPAYPSGVRSAVSSWTGPSANTSGQPIPLDLGLLAYTCHPDLAGSTFGPLTTNIYLCEFWVYEALTIGHVGMVFTTSPTLTAGCFAGIYSPGATNFTNVATTTDQAATWTGSLGNKTAALSASLTPGRYYAALLLTGSVMPSVRAATGAVLQLGNINLSGATLRCMIGATAQTTLATIPVSGFNASSAVFGMVFYA